LSKTISSHLKAVLQAFFVTLLWSSSWVLIKIGLEDIPALTFAGLRYTLAFLALTPFLLRRRNLEAMRNLSRRDWTLLVLLGLLFYTLTQGAQFVGLFYLPAVTVSLLLNFTAVIITILGIFFLAEIPILRQWIGVILAAAGGILYFYPIALPSAQVIGLIVVIIGVMANSGSAVLGRYINRSGHISALMVTVVSMGIGSVILLITGLSFEGLPALSLASWGIIVWLAIVNTAAAFTLWNHTLRTLSAMESGVINNTMLIQIAILAWVFLGERLDGQEIVGLIIAAVGTLMVQVKERNS
jgi:drug/metabolite transporter (DMT)-like permease